MMRTESEIRKAVRERYAALATREQGCCDDNSSSSSSCCSASSDTSTLGNVPAEASSVVAGCGSPISLLTLKDGDVVVDLGSGGGIDVFRASSLIGKSGHAIGVDATPEMIFRARETASKHGYENVEFRLGEIEHLPIETASADYVISNCVINLSPDKEQVLREAFRVLKPGGIFAVADITVEQDLTEELRQNLESWAGCVSGAIRSEEYKKLLEKAGFTDMEIRPLQQVASDSECCSKAPGGIISTHIKAGKPLE